MLDDFLMSLKMIHYHGNVLTELPGYSRGEMVFAGAHYMIFHFSAKSIKNKTYSKTKGLRDFANRKITSLEKRIEEEEEPTIKSHLRLFIELIKTGYDKEKNEVKSLDEAWNDLIERYRLIEKINK